MFRDLAYGLRVLARSPGVTAIAVLTLALGIGANTAMFSVVNALLIRPLPYPDAGRLVTIQAQIPSMNIFGAFVEYNTFMEWWLARSHSFESMTAYTPLWANLTSGSEPERVFVHRINSGFLSLSGARPVLGRAFLPEEDRAGAPRVALLSHALWKRRFGESRSVLGQQIALDRANYTVVGVLPADFDFYGPEVEVYTPIAASSARVRGEPSVGVHARLKPGVPLQAAQAEIDGLCRGWIEQYHYPKDWGARVWPLRDYYVRGVRSNLLILAAAVGLVLLIACANVANLLLARAAVRQREIAIRGALGAGRGRILRQLLTEGLLLATAAAVLGLSAAWAGVRALSAGGGYLPRQTTVSMDPAVLGFTAVIMVATVLLFGLAPAWAAADSSLAENLKESSRAAGEGVRRARFRTGLVILEVALALLLVIGAALTTRSLMRLEAVDPGFRAEGVLTADLTLPQESYGDPVRRVNFFRALLSRLQAMPGVQAAGMVSHLPFSHSKSGTDIAIEGVPPPRPGEQWIAFWRSIDPKYFQAMQVRLLKGRFFDARDPAGPPVAIINDTLARRGWPGQNPVGKRFSDGRGPWMTVVGIVTDLRQTSLAEDPDAEVYVPHTQTAAESMTIVVRTRLEPLRLAPGLRAAVRDLDKDLPISQVGVLAESISHSNRSKRFSAALFASFGAMALLLAAVGIYGVISYTVTQRAHEIGLRMALGAESRQIVWMVVGRAMLLAGAGVALGAAGALALTRLLRSMLFGVSATDPAVFAGVAVFLLMVAGSAGYLPARRAARIDPMASLRNE